MMRNFTLLILCMLSITTMAQQKLHGIVRNLHTTDPMSKVSVINMTTLEVVTTSSNGDFIISAQKNDVLHISKAGFVTLKTIVDDEWINEQKKAIFLSEDIEELEEIIINNLRLTGILQIDSRLIAFDELPYTKDLSITGYTPFTGVDVIGSIYRGVKNKSAKQQQIKRLQEENQIMELMKTRFDRELVSSLLDIDKTKIIDLLKTCNHTEDFIYTATDYQIFDALNNCLK
ncbi:hypothetical protein AB4865_08550 [Capnocytophaga sp. ARDL2]|uniref:hypothetical protein n=1 Tax=Capnocytophaga sp. ARDL2 TaxID=3238809 RepID=UPI003555E85A